MRFTLEEPLDYSRLKVGDTFEEYVNQAIRECLVLAVDGKGRALYSYVMPRGKVFVRVNGKPVSKLNAKWRSLMEDVMKQTEQKGSK